MKKALTLLLATLFLLGAVQGAALAETENKDIRVWLPPFGTEDTLDKEVWGGIMDKFAQETGANIELQIISWDAYPEKYLSGISSGNGPDVGYMYADMFPDFIEMGACADLAPYLTDEQRDNFLYLDEGFIMGAQYALPMILGNPRIIYYNKDILEAAGVPLPTEPMTWDEFVEACKACTKDLDGDGKIDQWGVAMGWGNKSYGVLQEAFTPFLLQAGGSMYAEDGRTATFGSEAGIKAAQYVRDLIFEHGVMPADCTGMIDADVGEMFKTGKLAFWPASTGSATTLPETLNWGFIPCLKDEQAATMMVADQLVLMSAARNPQLSYDLMIHMLSGESQTAFHTKLSQFPPIAKDEPYNDNPLFESLYANYSNLFHTEKPVKGAFKMNDYLYKNLQLVMMDEMSPQDALTEAQDYANSVLSE